MFNKLENIIKNVKGNILTVCLDDKLMGCFLKNNNVEVLSIDSNINSGVRNSKRKVFNGSKNISIKKLRKYINKKSVDVLFCNMNEMNNYYKYFIKDSIYLCNNTVYLYFDNEIDKDFLIKKYNRYNVVIEETEYKNGYILKIDVTNAKNNWFKDKLYLIHDTLYNLI